MESLIIIPLVALFYIIVLLVEGSIPQPSWVERQTANSRQDIYMHCLAGMLAKLAKADGRVCEAEIEVIDLFIQKRLQMSASERATMIEEFNHARDSIRSFESYLSEFVRNFRYDRQFKVVLLQILIEVAEADEKVEPIEISLLFNAATVLDLKAYFFSSSFYKSHEWRKSQHSRKSRYSYQSHRRSNTGTGLGQGDRLSEHYQVLGCHPSDSVAKIKKKHRSLVVKYHPDKLVSRGLPAPTIKIAREKFIEVQQAFEAIMKAKG